MRLRLLVLGAVTAGALAGPIGSMHRIQASGPQGAQERTGNVIVRFKSQATLGDVGSALSDSQTEAIASTGPSKLVLLDPQPGQSVDGAVADLEANPDVEYAEPDVLVHTTLTPNDSLYATYQWPAPQIGLPAAWDTTTGTAGVIVAVIDTGVDGAHPDLAGKITTGANAGYNFVSNNTNTADDNSHGTFVAGIIAANTNNSSGMAGVCWQCKIMPVKVLDNTGSGSSFNVSQGIDWAVSHGAKVANLSLGGGAAASLQTSVDNAWNAGVVVIAASGNDNGPVLYPAAYSNAIAVGSNDSTGARSSFSNYGPELDIVAPGGNVLGTLCTCNGYAGGYGTGSGTSFAAPHVSGVAALLIASGVTDPTQVRSRLLTTATDMGTAGFDNLTGWGRVNAAAAIAVVDTTPPSVSITSPANGATVSGNVAISATASDTSGIQRVWFYIDGAYLRSDAAAPYGSPWDTTGLTASHQIRARAYDNAGNFADATINVTIGGDTTPPALSITSPTNGATVAGTVGINATASDASGIQRVWFYIDGAYLRSDAAAPYGATWDTTGLSGSHQIRVRAYDNAGNYADMTISVNVSSDATGPTVTITKPLDGATVSGMISIDVTASDASGVQRVWFYIDGVYLRSDAAAPYNANWNATAAGPGPHVVRVRAYDNAGNYTAVTANVSVP